MKRTLDIDYAALTVNTCRHGLNQKGSEWMDGVAYITQCPIAQGLSFTYRQDSQHFNFAQRESMSYGESNVHTRSNAALVLSRKSPPWQKVNWHEVIKHYKLHMNQRHAAADSKSMMPLARISGMVMQVTLLAPMKNFFPFSRLRVCTLRTEGHTQAYPKLPIVTELQSLRHTAFNTSSSSDNSYAQPSCLFRLHF